MKKWNIFICYRGNSDASCELGTRIYTETQKYSVFFAPKSIKKGENFKTIVPKVMENVSIILLLLDEGFFDNCYNSDDIVLFELQEAKKNPNIIFLPIFINKFTFKNVDISDILGKDMDERIKHINGIDYNGIYDFKIENDLMPIIDNLFSGNGAINEMTKRDSKRYHSASDKAEVAFLEKQQKMLFDYDKPVFDELLKDKRDLVALDVGCNTGSGTFSRFINNDKFAKVIGIDRDEKCIEKAREKYSKAIFEVVDIESSDFKNNMNKILEENDIEGFDLINISMVLLHLEKPSRFLRHLKSFLNPKGVIFIRDIDDGLNLVYPDKEKYFSRMIDICSYCDILGYRQSGREIYSYLTDAGYKNVKLVKSGLSSSNMNEDEKEALFDLYFGYIPIALKKTIERKTLIQVSLDYEWVNEYIDDALELFMKEDFLFSLGYMIYTATK